MCCVCVLKIKYKMHFSVSLANKCRIHENNFAALSKISWTARQINTLLLQGFCQQGELFERGSHFFMALTALNKCIKPFFYYTAKKLVKKCFCHYFTKKLCTNLGINFRDPANGRRVIEGEGEKNTFLIKFDRLNQSTRCAPTWRCLNQKSKK